MTRICGVILECPSCGSRVRHYEYLSGNSIGAYFWTDGFSSGPMLPVESPLLVCPLCKSRVWEKDLRFVREAKGPCKGLTLEQFEQGEANKDGEWESLPSLKSATVDDINRELSETGSLLPQRGIYLRRQLWWESNHVYRFRERDEEMRRKPEGKGRNEDAGGSFDRSLSWRNGFWFFEDQHVPWDENNMERLIGLSGEDSEGGCLAKAELLRELGRFEEALEVLEGPAIKKKCGLAHFIGELCGRKDRFVRRLR